MTQHRIHLNDLVFDVKIDGPEDGPPVLLLHGWPQDSRSWAQVSRLLSTRGIRTIAPDQRGYSPDARPGRVEDYRIDLLSNDAIGIMSALGHERFHLVGHDWGASVAWALAASQPDRVETLTALSVPHLAAFGEALAVDADQQERSQYIGLLRREGKAEDVLLADSARRLRAMYTNDLPDAEVEGYVAALSEPGAMTAVLNWYRAMGAELRDTPPVTMPTTFIWGNNDPALGRYGAERCGDQVRADYRFIEVDGGHWLPDTHPGLVADEIVRRVETTA